MSECSICLHRYQAYEGDTLGICALCYLEQSNNSLRLSQEDRRDEWLLRKAGEKLERLDKSKDN